MNNHLPFNTVYIRSSRFIRTFIFTALLVLTGDLTVKPAEAAVECYFRDAPYTATLSFSGSVVSLLPHVTRTQMITDLNQKAATTKNARTDCSPGDSGEILYGIAGAIPQVDDYAGASPSAGLYATNIPGILIQFKSEAPRPPTEFKLLCLIFTLKMKPRHSIPTIWKAQWMGVSGMITILCFFRPPSSPVYPQV